MSMIDPLATILGRLDRPVQPRPEFAETLLSRLVEELGEGAQAPARKPWRARLQLPRRRSGERTTWRPRHVLLVAVLLLLLLLVAAAFTFGLRLPVLDFGHAEPAPRPTQLQFVQLGVGAPPGMDPRVIPNSARKVIELSHSGKVGVLWVAPTKGGGFCHAWTTFRLGAGCVKDRKPPSVAPASPEDVNPFALGASWDPDERGVLLSFEGHLMTPEAVRLLVEYADGEEVEIPIVWVSPPIEAGFYVYWVPTEHRRPGHQVTAITAEDEHGGVVARQTFRLTPAADVVRPVRLPDGLLTFLPAKAIVDKARKLIDFRAENGTRVTLWVVPTTEGGRCYVFSGGFGCQPPGYDFPPLGAGIQGGEGLVLLEGQVRDDVATYELRYEDGAVERLHPVEGSILHEIPSSHYMRGHRLERMLARGRDGHIIAQQAVQTSFAGVYPCEKPVDIGHGVMACP
jgi:hypothetical protein